MTLKSVDSAFIPKTPVPEVDSFGVKPAQGDGMQSEADLSAIGNHSKKEKFPLSAPVTDSRHVSSTIAGLGSLTGDQLWGDLNGLLFLMHKCAIEKAKSDKLVRKAESQASINSLKSAAKEIRDASFQTLMGSLASGCLTMGSGALQAKNAWNNLSSLKELNGTPQASPAPTTTPGSASALKADAVTTPGEIEMTEMIRRESTPNTASEHTADARTTSGDVEVKAIENQKQTIGENPLSKDSSALEQVRTSAPQQDTAQLNKQAISEPVQEEQKTQPDTKQIKPEGSDPQPEPATASAKESIQEPEQAKPSTERDVKLRKLDQSAAKLKGLSDTAHGLGSASNAFFQNSAAGHQARKAELEAESKAHDIAMQGAGDAIQTTMEQARAWRDILQAVNQGNIETSRGIARNI